MDLCVVVLRKESSGMAINGLNTYGSYGYYNTRQLNIGNDDTSTNPAAVLNVQTDASVVEQQSEAKSDALSINEAGTVDQGTIKSENQAPKNSNAADFTFDFKKNNNFNLVGATSSMEDMDLDKAMSDMKKDSVLDQYKFFVNPVNLGTDEDGTVRLVRQ
jgi:hypothetical protein